MATIKHHFRRIAAWTKEKDIFFIFRVSLFIKAFAAFIETLGGIAALFVTQQFLLRIVDVITRDELAENPQDFLANYLMRQAQSYSISAQHFTAFYLLSHGVIKLWIIVGLLRRKLWYYPVALIVFALFVAYQLYLYMFSHSLLILVLTILDIVIIGLTWHEYRYMKRRHAGGEGK